MSKVVVVTGLSGAGKTTALHTLEDLGFFCVDNLPTVLAPEAVRVCEAGGMERVALGIDVRVRSFLSAVEEVLSKLAAGGRDVSVLFLDASDETLLRRFSESRRPHPLTTLVDADDSRPTLVDGRSRDGAVAVLDGVHLERERLAPLRARATYVFDTTHLSVHELRRALIAQLGPASAGSPRMLTRIVSFGFKYGTPVDADLVLDVRFLENPYFIPELKHLPGTDPRVSGFVLGLPEAQEFLAKTRDLLFFMMPKYEREGKSYLTIAIGCTGGRHRSVALSDALADALAKEVARDAGEQAPVFVVHRDVARAERKATRGGGDGDEPEEPSERFSTTELKGALTPPPVSQPAIRGGKP